MRPGWCSASDQDAARAYAKIAKEVTGETPYLITSDDPKASAKIAEFSESKARLAVCVRMISEGVDIPRQRAWRGSRPIAPRSFSPRPSAAWCAHGGPAKRRRSTCPRSGRC